MSYVVVRGGSTRGAWIVEVARNDLGQSKADWDSTHQFRPDAECRATELNERDAAEARGECTCSEDGPCAQHAQPPLRVGITPTGRVRALGAIVHVATDREAAREWVARTPASTIRALAESVEAARAAAVAALRDLPAATAPAVSP